MTALVLPDIEFFDPPVAHAADHWSTHRAHGSGLLGYGALVDNCPLHVDPLGRGFTPFGCRSNVAIMLESPVCEPKLRATLTRDWIRAMRDQNRRPVGVHLDRELAEVFAGEGFRVNPLGVVTDLQLDEFDFTLPGKPFTQLRRWRNTAMNSGVSVREIDGRGDAQSEIETEAKDWPFPQALGRELAFMIRRTRAMMSPAARVFSASIDDELVAVAAFDPFYRGHKIAGYYFSLNRRAVDAPHGASDLIVLHAMQQFKREGVPAVSLGLSPLRKLHDSHGPNTPSYGRMLRMARRVGRRIYAFDNIGFHKSKYNGRESTAYGASMKALPVRELYALMKLCRIF